jgi:hypothetical protein
MACFIGLGLCSAAVAYIPALIVRECLHFRAQVAQEKTIPGNTTGTELYTDCGEYAPVLPNNRWLTKCPVCCKMLWNDKIDRFGYQALFNRPLRILRFH